MTSDIRSPASRRRRRNNRDYRPGYFHPRWACEEDGCGASGSAPDDTTPADLLDVLLRLYRDHVAAEHPEPTS